MLAKIILLLVAMAIQPVSAQRGVMPEPMIRLRESMAATRPSPPPRPTAILRRTAVDTSSPAYLLLDAAYAALREEDLDGAVENFEKAIPLQPERTDIRKDLAYTYLRIGENELGRRQFEKVVELDAKDYRSQLELAFLDYDTGSTGLKAKARELFVVVAKEGDPELQATARGAVSFIDGETAIRMAPFLRAVEIDANDAIGWYRVAIAREERNEYSLATDAYRATARVSPGARVLMGLARSLLASGQSAEGLRTLRAVVDLKDDAFSSEEARELLASLRVP